MDVNTTLPMQFHSPWAKPSPSPQSPAPAEPARDWQPAPPLRPTVQDRIDIDQRLLALRRAS